MQATRILLALLLASFAYSKTIIITNVGDPRQPYPLDQQFNATLPGPNWVLGGFLISQSNVIDGISVVFNSTNSDDQAISQSLGSHTSNATFHMLPKGTRLVTSIISWVNSTEWQSCLCGMALYYDLDQDPIVSTAVCRDFPSEIVVKSQSNINQVDYFNTSVQAGIFGRNLTNPNPNGRINIGRIGLLANTLDETTSTNSLESQSSRSGSTSNSNPNSTRSTSSSSGSSLIFGSAQIILLIATMMFVWERKKL